MCRQPESRSNCSTPLEGYSNIIGEILIERYDFNIYRYLLKYRDFFIHIQSGTDQDKFVK